MKKLDLQIVETAARRVCPTKSVNRWAFRQGAEFAEKLLNEPEAAKPITPESLIALGFTENFVSAEESGSGEFTYYTYETSGGTALISTPSDEEPLGHFGVEFFESSIRGTLRELSLLESLLRILDEMEEC